MARKRKTLENNVVNLSALDIFANGVGALAFLLLIFVANAIELAQPTPLQILTERVPVSQAGTEYIGILSAVGGVHPYLWSLRSGALPEGIVLDQERGEIEGTPSHSAEEKTYQFEVEVSDSRKKWARAYLEIRVLPLKREDEASTRPLVLLTHGELPDALVDRPYAIYLSARGGSGQYNWSAEGLPEGFSVEFTSGLLRGTSRASGIHELVLRVRDEREGMGDAGTAVAVASLRILPAEGEQKITAEPQRPLILTEILPPAEQSKPYIMRLAGEGLDPLNWSAQYLPPGLSIKESGVITGIPEQTMKVNITVSMTDARNIKASNKVLILTVNPPSLSPMDLIKKRGIFGWLGYLILVLLTVAYHFLLRRKMAQDVAMTLKLHNVELIQKPDGQAALSGSHEETERVQKRLRQMHFSHRRNRIISYIVLGAAIIAYTLFLLR
jgi:hypothetical protein